MVTTTLAGVGEGLGMIRPGFEHEHIVPDELQSEAELARRYIEQRCSNYDVPVDINLSKLGIRGVVKHTEQRKNGLLFSCHSIFHVISDRLVVTSLLKTENGTVYGLSDAIHADTHRFGSSDASRPVNGNFTKIIRPFAVLQSNLDYISVEKINIIG